MTIGKRLVLLVVSAAALSSLGCTAVVLGAPKFPPCYLDNEAREQDADSIRKQYPATYDWIRRMDAICVGWTVQ